MSEQVQSVDNELKKTDLGQVIQHNKNNILIGAILILVAIIAYSLYSSSAQKNKSAQLAKIYALKLKILKIFSLIK